MSNNTFPSQKLVDSIKREYPAGTKIVLDRMGDDPRPIPSGTKGVVRMVDDIGIIHCDFENGRSLGLIPEEDAFHKVEEKPQLKVRPMDFATKREINGIIAEIAKRTGVSVANIRDEIYREQRDIHDREDVRDWLTDNGHTAVADDDGAVSEIVEIYHNHYDCDLSLWQNVEAAFDYYISRSA